MQKSPRKLCHRHQRLLLHLSDQWRPCISLPDLHIPSTNVTAYHDGNTAVTCKLTTSPCTEPWTSILKLPLTYGFHTHTGLTALFPGLPGWAGTRKVKPIWILLKQETVSSSGISWAICKSAPRSRQITTPAPHHSVFLQAGCHSCRPTNSVKALKVNLS